MIRLSWSSTPSQQKITLGELRFHLFRNPSKDCGPDPGRNAKNPADQSRQGFHNATFEPQAKLTVTF